MIQESEVGFFWIGIKRKKEKRLPTSRVISAIQVPATGPTTYQEYKWATVGMDVDGVCISQLQIINEQTMHLIKTNSSLN